MEHPRRIAKANPDTIKKPLLFVFYNFQIKAPKVQGSSFICKISRGGNGSIEQTTQNSNRMADPPD